MAILTEPKANNETVLHWFGADACQPPMIEGTEILLLDECGYMLAFWSQDNCWRTSDWYDSKWNRIPEGFLWAKL